MSTLNIWPVQACHPVSAFLLFSVVFQTEQQDCNFLLMPGAEVALGWTSLVLVGHRCDDRRWLVVFWESLLQLYLLLRRLAWTSAGSTWKVLFGQCTSCA